MSKTESLTDGVSGNVIHFEGEGVSVLVPPGCPLAASRISVEEMKNVPAGGVKAFSFAPGGVAFEKPLKAQFHVSQMSLPPGVARESLRVAALEGGRWKPVKGSRYDPATSSVSAPISHFSLYGLVASPGAFSGRGTEFEVNGVAVMTEDSVYGRLFVAPAFISFYAEMDAADRTSMTITGLPTDGEHHVYVNSHDDHALLTPSDGGEITLPLSLSGPSLVWIQPQPSTIVIGGGPEVDECASYGERTGDVCTLMTDGIGDVELRGGTLDCNGHSITQPATYGGLGMGVLVPPNIYGTVIENCTIGSGSGYFAYGIEAYGSDTVVVSNNTLIDNIIGVLFQGVSNSFVSDNHVSGASLWAVALWESSLGNEISGNSIDVDNDAITIEGLVVAPASSDNRVFDNTITRGTGGILLGKTSDNTVKQNTVSGVLTALSIGSAAWPNSIYRNNFQGSIYGVYSTIESIDLSDETYGGNWWGHSCPEPLFMPGVDGVPDSVRDNRAYGQKDAWLLGVPPGCAGDTDGDGVPDASDNCPGVSNPGQANADGTGEGDACDKAPPAPPVITSPIDGAVIGTSLPVFDGLSERKSLVDILECPAVPDGILTCTAVGAGVASESGVFSIPAASPLPDGIHSFVAVATDAAGNVSSPSNSVVIAIDTVVPPPPRIIHPYDGEIVRELPLQVTGSTMPHLITMLFDYGVYFGETITDDVGEFEYIWSDLEEGDHLLTVVSISEAGRASSPSRPVEFSVGLISTGAPVTGSKGKISITRISDSPDPFDPYSEKVDLSASYTISRVRGLGGVPQTHRFYTILQWNIKYAGSDVSLARMGVEKDVLPSPGGGIISDSSGLPWNGKDAWGGTPKREQTYDYDVSLKLIRKYIGGGRGPRCSRDEETYYDGPGAQACIIDKVNINHAGTIHASPFPPPPPGVECPDPPKKFIAKGYSHAMDMDGSHPVVAALRSNSGFDGEYIDVLPLESTFPVIELTQWNPDRWPEDPKYDWLASGKWENVRTENIIEGALNNVGIPYWGLDTKCNYELNSKLCHEWSFQLFATLIKHIVPQFDLDVDDAHNGNIHMCFVFHDDMDESAGQSPYNTYGTLVHAIGEKADPSEDTWGDYKWHLYFMGGDRESEIEIATPIPGERFVRPFGCSIEVQKEPPYYVWIAFVGPGIDPASEFTTAPWWLYKTSAETNNLQATAAPVGMKRAIDGSWVGGVSDASGLDIDMTLDARDNPHFVFQKDEQSLDYTSYDNSTGTWGAEIPILFRFMPPDLYYINPRLTVVEGITSLETGETRMIPFIVATKVSRNLKERAAWYYPALPLQKYRSSLVVLRKGYGTSMAIFGGDEPRYLFLWHESPNFFEDTIVDTGDYSGELDQRLDFDEFGGGIPADIKVTKGGGIKVAYIRQAHFTSRKSTLNSRDTALNGTLNLASKIADDLARSGDPYTIKPLDSLAEGSQSLSMILDGDGKAKIAYSTSVIWNPQVTYYDESSGRSLFPIEPDPSLTRLPFPADECAENWYHALRLTEDQLNFNVWAGADDFGYYLGSIQDDVSFGIHLQTGKPEEVVKYELIEPYKTFLRHRQGLFSPHKWPDNEPRSVDRNGNGIYNESREPPLGDDPPGKLGHKVEDMIDPVETHIVSELFSGISFRNGMPLMKVQNRVCLPDFMEPGEQNLADMCGFPSPTYYHDYGSYASRRLSGGVIGEGGVECRCKSEVETPYDRNGFLNPELEDPLSPLVHTMTCDPDGTCHEEWRRESWITCDRDEYEGIFKQCSTDFDCGKFYCVNANSIVNSLMDPSGYYKDKNLCVKPLTTECSTGYADCPPPAFCGPYKGIDADAESSPLIKDACVWDEKSLVPADPYYDYEMFECSIIGCSACYKNAICMSDEDCPPGHYCEEGKVSSPACILRQVLDDPWYKELDDGVKEIYGEDSTSYQSFKQINDIKDGIYSLKVPRYFRIDEGGENKGWIAPLRFRVKEAGLRDATDDYSKRNHTGFHVVSQVENVDGRPVARQGEIWFVLELDKYSGFHAEGEYRYSGEMRTFQIQLPRNPDDFEGLYIRTRILPYVWFNDDGTPVVEFISKGTDILKSLDPETVITSEDIKNSIVYFEMEWYEALVADCIYDRLPPKLSPMIQGTLNKVFGKASMDGLLKNTASLLIYNPEIAYPLLGQRCSFQGITGGGGGNIVEAVGLEGTLDYTYQFNPFDFNSPSWDPNPAFADSRVNVYYRGETKNYDPYLCVFSNPDPYTPHPDIYSFNQVVLTDMSAWEVLYTNYPDEHEPTGAPGRYYRAQCEVNADNWDPTTYDTCPLPPLP